jgi:hypothetical protein
MVCAAAKRQEYAVVIVSHGRAEQERGGDHNDVEALAFHWVSPNCSRRRRTLINTCLQSTRSTPDRNSQIMPLELNSR